MNNPEKNSLIARWDKVLLEIETRFFELLEESVQASEHFISEILYDSVALSNAWSGVFAEMQKLESRAEKIWSGNMDELYGMRDDVSSEERYEQYHKRTALNLKMELAFIKAKTKALADAGRKIYENILNALDTEKKYNCTQCSAPLKIPFLTFVSKNFKCDACGTVNSYEPDSRMTKIEFYYLDALADEKVLPLHLELMEKEYQLSKLNPVSDDQEYEVVKQKYNDLRQEEISVSHDFLIEMVPDKAKYYTARKERQLSDI